MFTDVCRPEPHGRCQFHVSSLQKRHLLRLELQPPTGMSFLSVEPQSRVLLENYSNSLLAQFDTQLDIVADRYLAFFQERSVNVVRVLHFTLTVRF